MGGIRGPLLVIEVMTEFFSMLMGLGLGPIVVGLTAQLAVFGRQASPHLHHCAAGGGKSFAL